MTLCRSAHLHVDWHQLQKQSESPLPQPHRTPCPRPCPPARCLPSPLLPGSPSRHPPAHPRSAEGVKCVENSHFSTNATVFLERTPETAPTAARGLHPPKQSCGDGVHACSPSQQVQATPRLRQSQSTNKCLKTESFSPNGKHWCAAHQTSRATEHSRAGLQVPLHASSALTAPSMAGWPASLQKSPLTLTGEKESERQKCFKSKYLHALGETSPHQRGKVHHYWLCLQSSSARSNVVRKKESKPQKTSFKSHSVLAPRIKCLPSLGFTCANFFFHVYALSHPSLGTFLLPKAKAVCTEEKCHLQPAMKAPRAKRH